MTNHEAQLIAQTTMEQFRQAAARKTAFERLQEARNARIYAMHFIRRDDPRYQEPIKARWEDKP